MLFRSVEVVATQKHWDDAMDVHRKSVVLLKNENVLPLTDEKLEGKKVYAEFFAKKEEAATKGTEELRNKLKEDSAITLTDNYEEADVAILFASPSSGDYFNATPGYLELDICEEKVVCNVDDFGRPVSTTHKETTLYRANALATIANAVHANGGKVIANINFVLAWQVGNVEVHADVLLAGFDTYQEATMDVIRGRFSPTGKMPITLPKDDSVLAVNADGICISPNDVPGYDKDQYMPESMKDENGKAYAYRDAAGNYYEMNFGLRY